MTRKRYVRGSQGPSFNKGDRLELTVVREPMYQSSGPGANRQSKKRVVIVGDWRANNPSALAAGSVSVKDDRGNLFRLSIDWNDVPLGLVGQRSRYSVEEMKRLPSGRQAGYHVRAMAHLPYEEHIVQGVTSDEKAAHLHLLKEIEPIERALRQLQRNGSRMAAFDAEEQATLEDARRILRRKSVPMALVSVIEQEELPLFLDD